MTSSQNSKFSSVYGVDISREDLELSQIISEFNPLYQFRVGKTHKIDTVTICDHFDEVLKDFFPGIENTPISYRELGESSGAIYTFKDRVLFMDCVQRGDGSGYIETTMFSRFRVDEKIAKALASKLSDFISAPWDEIEWISNNGGSLTEATFPIKKYDPIMPEVYPFIPNVEKWVEKYLASKSNVLILNGPMGTGKSSLIAHIIRVGKLKSMTAFDSKVMKDDYLYTKFITEEYGLIVLEDADLLLLKRVEGENDTMSKLLNVSEGLIDTSNKKIIFTANLGNTKDIDPALKRPGRCFDIVEFRELEMHEANSARTKLGRGLFSNEKRSYSLAQVYQTE